LWLRNKKERRMKLSGRTVLAAIAAGSLAAAPMLAQTHVEMHRTTTVTTTNHNMHRSMHGKRRVCHTRWVHHHKVRKCTWQRW
jgi:hypothetical protein